MPAGPARRDLAQINVPGGRGEAPNTRAGRRLRREREHCPAPRPCASVPARKNEKHFPAPLRPPGSRIVSVSPNRPRRPASLPPSDKLTPMFRQWRQAKREHPDALLLFRMGDFYELFFEDAQIAAPILEIALTARGKGTACEAPMCGVPHHAARAYIAKLVERGHRVAVCEQMEDPKKTKKMVRREVVRVVSPGTLTDAERLDPGAGNHLAGVAGAPEGPFGAAIADLSTGGLVLAAPADASELTDLLLRYRVRELIAPCALADALSDLAPDVEGRQPLVITLPDERFDRAAARAQVLEALGVRTLAGFGCRDDHPALPAAAATLAHLAETQRVQPAHLDRLRVEDPRRVLLLDESTRRNLELVESLRDGSRRHTLLDVVDETRTAMGARLVRRWLLEPERDVKEICRRHGVVETLVARGDARQRLREALGRIRDLERLLGRAALGTVSPLDLAALRLSLLALPEVEQALALLNAPGVTVLGGRLDRLGDLAEHLNRALEDEPGAVVGEGRVIRASYDAELDEARELARGGRRLIGAIETRERQRTGISSLKVKYNRVFGYFIAVSKANLSRVPSDYERRQTLATGERFVTPEIKELESRILSAEERLGAREKELFTELVREVTARSGRIRGTAEALAEIDTLAGFAEAAAAEGYSRPEVFEGDVLVIEDGRHPVVERLLPAGGFVPNDCRLDESERIVIVTGPNMGGKSTYLRQVALIAIMAQAGSFVPARAARLGVLDRVFCRVGAADNLAGGQSTFMVEMTETANILHNASPESLVILDEIGRGTATFDGMAIAWSVVEHLHDDPRLRPKVLFATHYHELTELAGERSRVANAHIAVKERGHEIVFLHRVDPGPSDRSYGIHVARIAGLPDAVVARAREILERLATEHSAATSGDSPQLSLFEADAAPAAGTPSPGSPRDGPSLARELVIARLAEVDPDELSPREAQALLYELQRLMRADD